jgi:hypothetical protein
MEESIRVKTLLLNSTFQPIAFLDEKKAIKLLVKNKVEILSKWDHKINYGLGYFELPAIIRLTYYISWKPRKKRFNRNSVFRRDQYICQYCGKACVSKETTIDHIIPISRGGKTDYLNCVVACLSCNLRKSNKLTEEVGMKLINNPFIPNLDLLLESKSIAPNHPDWSNFLF